MIDTLEPRDLDTDGADAGRDAIGDDDGYASGLNPAARRQLRRQRLVDEQRKRIALEESEKAEADAAIRNQQAELSKLLEANSRLQAKVESCEHNVDETRDAVEDMHFQRVQSGVQKENALAVLTGETHYLTEHTVMVGRKSSELTSRMAEVEAAVAASAHKLQRVEHANEIATADRRRELEALRAESERLRAKFEQLREDVKMLYQEKISLHQKLAAAQTEAADVEACVAQYRKSVANLIA